MKQLTAIMLSLLILVSSLGLSLQVSYCTMKKRTSYSLTGGKRCCCKSEKPGKNKCCKNKVVRIAKVTDTYKASGVLKIKLTPLFDEAGPLYAAATQASWQQYPAIRFLRHRPPDKPLSRVILHRQFLI